MPITVVKQEELGEIIDVFRKISSQYGRETVRDVAKVYFGVQSGDRLVYGPDNRDFFQRSFSRFSDLNSSFQYEAVERQDGGGTLIYFNPDLTSQQSLDDYRNQVVEGWDSEDKQAHFIQATFYGFPECCIDAWTKNLAFGQIKPWSFSDKSIIPFTRSEMDGLDLTWNGGISHNGIQPSRFIEHIPCSPYCNETAKIAEKYRPVIEFVDSVVPEILR